MPDGNHRGITGGMPMCIHETNDNTLEQIQKCCLGIVADVDRVCRKNGIEYSLCGGSVIGAHLYQGFIPWDDDIDLMMTRENYDRFLEIYPREAAEYYHLHHYSTDGADNLPALFLRVEDLRTHMHEQIARGERSGHVFIDITVMDQVPTPLYYRIARLYAGYTYTFLYRKNGMTPGTGWKKAAFSAAGLVARKGELTKRYERLENFLRRRSRGRKTRYCAELLSAAYSGILYEQRIFLYYRDTSFAGLKLRIVRDYMDYLYMRYGRREFTRDVPSCERQQQHIQRME